MARAGYGLKNGLQRGHKGDGRGRNRTSATCRHPAIKARRKK